jgi:hypothetical protein
MAMTSSTTVVMMVILPQAMVAAQVAQLRQDTHALEVPQQDQILALKNAVMEKISVLMIATMVTQTAEMVAILLAHSKMDTFVLEAQALLLIPALKFAEMATENQRSKSAMMVVPQLVMVAVHLAQSKLDGTATIVMTL